MASPVSKNVFSLQLKSPSRSVRLEQNALSEMFQMSDPNSAVRRRRTRRTKDEGDVDDEDVFGEAGSGDQNLISNPDDDGEDDEEEIQCYICWESNITEENPIRRDCGCKGSVGWVHIDCLIASAETKGTRSIFDPIFRPWIRCNQCMQNYKDPTKSSLRDGMLRDHPRWRQNIIAAASKTFAVLCLSLIAICQFQRAIARPIAYAIVQADYTAKPMLFMTWNKTPQHVQIMVLCITGFFLYKRLLRPYWDVLREQLLFEFLLRMGANIVLHVIRHREGYNNVEQGIYICIPLVILACAVHRNRQELRQNIIDIRRQHVLETTCRIVLGFVVMMILLLFVQNVLSAYAEEEMILLLKELKFNPPSSVGDRILNDIIITTSAPKCLLTELLFIKDSGTTKTRILDHQLKRTTQRIGDRRIQLAIAHLGLLGEPSSLSEMANVAKGRPFRDDYWYCCA
jgi:hypothetical protein